MSMPAATDPGTNTDPAAPPAAPPAVPTPPPAAPPAPPATDPAEPNPSDDESPWNDPVKAKNEIERLRRERGDERIQAKKDAADAARKEIADSIAVALGIKPGEDAAPTVESLTASVATVTDERDAARTEATEAKRANAVLKAAIAAGVNPARLDYVEFLLGKRQDVTGASLDDANFGATLSAAIADEVAKDSSLKASGAFIGTGGPGFSGSGASGQMTKAEFDALPYAKRVDLYNTNRAEYDRLVNS